MAKILIVEDDDFLRNLLSKKLKEDGHEVEQAESGEKGVDMLPKVKPDLLVLDLLLPSLHGLEVLSWLKEQEGDLADIPVIVLSNLGNEEDIEKAYEIGAKDFLVKAKFTPQEIVDKVRAITG